MQLADFLWSQFGVETLAQLGWRFGRVPTDDRKAYESGIYALHMLGEDETIARLATGIRRFKLPDEFNYIKIYQQVAGEPRSAQAVEALDRLAQIFENRRQYPQGGRLLAAAAHGLPCPRCPRAWQGCSTRCRQLGRFEPRITSQPAAAATDRVSLPQRPPNRVHGP